MRFAPRRARKKDQSEKLIVEALRAAGCMVWDELPCDLLVLPPDRWPYPRVFMALECKTPRKGKSATDKRQEAQRKFLAATNTPVVTNASEALSAVGLSNVKSS